MRQSGAAGGRYGDGIAECFHVVAMVAIEAKNVVNHNGAGVIHPLF